MQPEHARYLRDVLDAAIAIEQAVTGATQETYLNSRVIRDATNWNYCIIGEALSQLKRIAPDIVDRISEYKKIIGLRNQLIHGYGVIDNRMTWNIITTKLPILRQEVEQLLVGK